MTAKSAAKGEAAATLQNAIKHLSPRLTISQHSRARVADIFNSEDHAAMILRDALFCIETEQETSLAEVRKARRGAWKLKPEFAEVIHG